MSDNGHYSGGYSSGPVDNNGIESHSSHQSGQSGFDLSSIISSVTNDAGPSVHQQYGAPQPSGPNVQYGVPQSSSSYSSGSNYDVPSHQSASYEIPSHQSYSTTGYSAPSTQHFTPSSSYTLSGSHSYETKPSYDSYSSGHSSFNHLNSGTSNGAENYVGVDSYKPPPSGLIGGDNVQTVLDANSNGYDYPKPNGSGLSH